jgi:hypothetical protein
MLSIFNNFNYTLSLSLLSIPSPLMAITETRVIRVSQIQIQPLKKFEKELIIHVTILKCRYNHDVSYFAGLYIML